MTNGLHEAALDTIAGLRARLAFIKKSASSSEEQAFELQIYHGFAFPRVEKGIDGTFVILKKKQSRIFDWTYLHSEKTCHFNRTVRRFLHVVEQMIQGLLRSRIECNELVRTHVRSSIIYPANLLIEGYSSRRATNRQYCRAGYLHLAYVDTGIVVRRTALFSPADEVLDGRDRGIKRLKFIFQIANDNHFFLQLQSNVLPLDFQRVSSLATHNPNGDDGSEEGYPTTRSRNPFSATVYVLIRRSAVESLGTLRDLKNDPGERQSEQNTPSQAEAQPKAGSIARTHSRNPHYPAGMLSEHALDWQAQPLRIAS